jgi:LysR family pca operon transcriptional activator
MDKRSEGRIKLRHLQCVIALARHRSVGRAADALAVTQPAVSKTLSELEGLLGARLFERGRGGAAPTPQGEAFVRHALASVAALREGLDALAQEGSAGVVQLGVLPTVAVHLVPPVLRLFRVGRPDVDVRLTIAPNADLLAQLRDREIEVAIGRLSGPDQMLGLSFEHLYAEPLTIAARAGHPLTQRRSPSVAELLAYPLLLPPSGTLIRQAADNFLVGQGARAPRGVTEVLSVSTGRALVLDSDAAWFVPRGAVADDIRRGLLVALPYQMAGTEEPVGLILRTDAAPAPLAQALVDAIRRASRQPV